MSIRADARAILNASNETLWVRSASYPIREAAKALRELSTTQHPLYLIESWTNEYGYEKRVRFFTPSFLKAQEEKEEVQGQVIEVWHEVKPSLMCSSEPVAKSLFAHVADFVLEASTEVEPLLDSVYALTQNVHADWNPAAPQRSTSVGDVLRVSTDKDTAYRVASIGFERVSFI